MFGRSLKRAAVALVAGSASVPAFVVLPFEGDTAVPDVAYSVRVVRDE